MKHPCLIPFLLFVFLPLAARGQSASFELLAQNGEYGFAYAIAELPDSSLCLATSKGLHVYALTDSGFVLRSLHRGPVAYDFAVTPEGTVFAAHGKDGLYAYEYTGEALQPVSAYRTGSNFLHVAAVAMDTIVVSGTNALYALHRDGASLTAFDSLSLTRPVDAFAIVPGGDVITANRFLDTVRAYRIQDGRFVQTASLHFGRGVLDIVADASGNVYFGTTTEGVRAYRYDGSAFSVGPQILSEYVQSLAVQDGLLLIGVDGKMLAYRCNGDSCELAASAVQFSKRGPGRIFAGSANRVFTSWWNSGMEMYRVSNDSLLFLNRVNEGGYASAVAEGEGGIFYLANGGGGLRAYIRDGSMLRSVAHINEGGSGNDLAVGDDGTLYLANDRDGIRAYKFDASGISGVGHLRDTIGSCDHILWGADSTIYTNNSMHGFRAFKRAGEDFILRAVVPSLELGVEDMVVSGDSTVFLADGLRGLLAYVLSGDSLMERAVTKVQYINGVAVGLKNTSYADGTVFASNGEGLYAFDYDGENFKLLVQDRDIHASKVRVDTRGTVFVTADGQVRAYSFDGDAFTLLAAYDLPCWNIALGDSGIVYAMHTQLSVLQYHQIPTDIVDAPSEHDHILQNHPNPFNPSTTISFNLKTAHYVTLVVTDLCGREVRRLLDGCFVEAGLHQVQFHAMDLPTGVYFYCLLSGGRRHLGRMVLLR